MDRRTFAQLFTLSAGSLGLMQAGGQAHGAAADQRPDTAAASSSGRSAKAVNVEDLKELARAALPRASFDYIATGSADEVTLHENIAAFQRLQLLPPLMRGISDADLSTTALGQKIELPVLLAPVAAQRMFHPEGGLAAARAAATAGTIYGCSSSVGNSVEEIAAAGNGPKWFQLYVPKDRTVARQLVRRVEQSGYQAIIVTVDLGEWKDADRRNRFALPKEMLVKHLRDVGFSQINDRMSEEAVTEFNANAWDLSLSWEFFDWLRDVTTLPILIKGVLRAEDARKAASIGLDGVVVSNHGGRRLDGVPAAIDVLPSVVEAVNGQAEVFMDGGVRRGTDVLKALAFGARAVLIGRPYAWALAADGQAGVARVLELFRQELLNAMIATGCGKLSEINRELLR